MTIRLVKDCEIEDEPRSQGEELNLSAPEEFWHVAIGLAEYTVVPDRYRPAYPLTGILNAKGQIIGHYGAPDGEEHLAWDDLRFPAQGINPAGQVAPPTVDTTTYPGTLLFAHNATNLIGGVAQLPHAWKRGSAIRPHVHWAKSTSAAGAVAWEIAYAVASIGGTFAAYSDWLPCTLAASDSDTAHKHAISSFAEIEIDDELESCILLWQIRRNHASEADTYDAAARLFEFDIHYQMGKFGTVDEIPS